MSESIGQPFTAEQRARFRPPRCPRCNSENVSVNWEHAGEDETTGVPIWTPTLYACRSCHGSGG